MIRRYSAQSRFLALLTTFALALLLGACGGGGGGGGGSAPAANNISQILPASGSPAGGTPVVITGTNFSGATGVTFGGVAGTAFTLDSDTQITVTTPAGIVGSTDVVVIRPAGNVTGTDAFLYFAPVSAVAGTTAGDSGDTAAATAAQLDTPTRIATDAAGNVYISDSANHRIRVVARASGTWFGVTMTAGNIYTIAGGGGAYGEAGAATAAQLDTPTAITFDSAGNLFIADTGNHRIRMVPAADGTWYGIAMTANNIYTVAGTGAATTPATNGTAGTAADLDQPFGLAFDSVDNLYFAERGNHRVLALVRTTGTWFGINMATANALYTVMGDGTAGLSANGTAAPSSRLNSPLAVAFDSADNLYVASTANHLVQVVARASATLFGVAATAGNAYIVAGQIAFGTSGDGGLATAARFITPSDLAFDSAGNLYITDYSGGRVRTVARVTGEYFGIAMTASFVHTVAGSVGGNAGDGGAATAAEFSGLTGITFDGTGNMFLVDQASHRVRQVTP